MASRMASERQVSLAQLAAWLAGLRVGRSIVEIIDHHSWVPTVAQCRRAGGLATVRGVRRYHQQVRHWSDNGYQIMVTADGEIFLCRPMGRSGGHCLGHNAHSIGVCFIGNFDSGHDAPPQQYAGYRTLVSVMALLCRRFAIPVSRIYPHRQFANKSCPGTGFAMGAFRQEVAAAMGNAIAPRPFRVSWAGKYLAANAAELRDGSTWVRAADVARIEGRKAHWRPADNKVYVQ